MTQADEWSDETGPWPPPRHLGWRGPAKRWLIRIAGTGGSARDPEDGIAVLAYHATAADRRHPWWTDFAGQMSLLEDLGYEIVPLAEAVQRLRTGRLGNRPAAAITFDDGWANNLDVAFPELSRRRWPASVFIPTSYVGRRPFLREDEVRRLADFGVSAELHTDSHADLTTIDEPAILDELARCRDRLTHLTGRPPRFLCYPFGRVDQRVRDVVARSGVEAACTARVGRNRPGEDLWLLRRISVDSRDRSYDLRVALAGGTARIAALKRLVGGGR